jgi:structural maintenance of chromosome 1
MIQDNLILRRILFKLFHIEESIEADVRDIQSKNKTLTSLREEQRVHDRAQEQARAEQARARTAVMQKEKKVKKAEKAVETRVRPHLVFRVDIGPTTWQSVQISLQQIPKSRILRRS